MLSPFQETRWNRAHALFRKAIGEQHDVTYIGPGYKGDWPDKGPYYVPHLVKEFGPFDFIITYGLTYSLQFHGLAEITKVKKAHFACDLVPAIPGWQGSITPYMKFFERDKYDCVFALSEGVIKTLTVRGVCEKEGKDCFFLPFGVDTDTYTEPETVDWADRPIDIMTSFSIHDAIYPMRSKINKLLDPLKDVNSHTARCFGDTFVNNLHKSKIGVNASSAYKRFNLKPLEIMACGALCFTDYVDEYNERLKAFSSGKYCVIYYSLEDFKEKLYYYLANPDKGEEIALRGMLYARRYHSNKVRIKEMTKCLKKLT